MATNLDQVSNIPETKYEKIKNLLDKGGSLKDGIKDDKGNLQIFMEGDKIIGLDDVYDLKIIAKTIIGDIDTKVLDIVITGDKVKINTDKGIGEISRIQFNTALEGRIKTGSYVNDINGNHIEFRRIATINRPNPAIIDAKKTGKSAEVMGSSEAQRQTLLDEVQKQGVDLQASKGTEALATAGTIEGVEKQMSFFGKMGDKFSGIWDALEKGFDLIFDGKFKEGFAAIMAGFTGKKEEDKKKGEEKKDDVEKQKIDDVEKQKIDIYKYNVATKSLSLMFTKEGTDKNKIDSILNQNTFKELSLNDIVNHYNNYRVDKKYDLVGKLGLKDKGFTNNEIFQTLGILATGESRKIIDKKYPNGNERSKMKAKEIISGLYSELGDVGKFTSFTISDISDIKTFMENNDFGIGVDEVGGKMDIKGGMKEKAQELGLSKETIIYMLSSGSTIGTDIQTLKSKINGEDSNLSDTDKSNIENKILPFGYEMQKSMISDNKINLGCDIKDFLKTNPLNLKEILNLYVITGGKSDYSQMNSFEQISLHMFLAKKLEGYENGSYIGKIGSLAVGGIEGINIPEPVKHFFNTVYGKVEDSLWESAKTSAYWIGGLRKEHPIAAGTILAYIIFGRWIPVHTSLAKIVK